MPRPRNRRTAALPQKKPAAPSVRSRRRQSTAADRRRALELLAAFRDGCTEALLVHGHGIAQATLVELVRAGLATAHAERVLAGREMVEMVTVWITAAGRATLAEGG